ncbi:hypothetical protein FVB9288_01754 [Flavobacterium sp. CECT 9288]|uniref:hypothetical protein n=1 Tax=Flavobacterium sp. CECT 9288 TaxID=2845819 RepID=UPI001E2B95A7|nr:hypothetical protein [Flavobacterium sp. CECT 9288]CAH0336081.1 hypothetical protein FVB9288_01754 [Flavobacterium sp. CECT 9288]
MKKQTLFYMVLTLLLVFLSCKKADNITKTNNLNNKIKPIDSVYEEKQQKDIFINNEFNAMTELVDVKALDFKETSIDSIWYGLYNIQNTDEYIFSVNKFLDNQDVERYKTIDTINLKSRNIVVKVEIFNEFKTLNLFLNKKLIKKWKFKITKSISENFKGKFTVSVEGDYTNHGREMYNYEINISENEISLHETGSELCSGRYRGKENNNKLELFYVQDSDERCEHSKASYTIKKEGGQFYIQGVGGEGTYNEWTPLKKVTKFEN